MTAGNLRFGIRDDDRQGPWSPPRLEGKPATRHQIDDERILYVTLHLSEFLDVGP